jgi:hypothetical protein
MNNAAKSVYGFGLYLLALSVIVIVTPNTLLGLLGLPPTDEVWIRVIGVLVLILGFYFTQAARKGLTDFFRWTVYVRSSLILFLAAFVALGFAGPSLILLGVVDLLGAVWTALALRQAS